MRMGNSQASGSMYGKLCRRRRIGWLRSRRIRHLRRGRTSRRWCLRLSTNQQTTEKKRQDRRLEETLHHEWTASPLGASAGFEVSPTSHPSRIWMVRVPYDALTSEWVTCTMVVPLRFSCVNSSMISLAWLECRLRSEERRVGKEGRS